MVARLFGMVWAMCMCGIEVMVVFVVFLLASVNAWLFPWMHECALTFEIVTLCVNHVMW